MYRIKFRVGVLYAANTRQCTVHSYDVTHIARATLTEEVACAAEAGAAAAEEGRVEEVEADAVVLADGQLLRALVDVSLAVHALEANPTRQEERLEIESKHICLHNIQQRAFAGWQSSEKETRFQQNRQAVVIAAGNSMLRWRQFAARLKIRDDSIFKLH